MSQEQENRRIPLVGIYINLEQRSIVFVAADKSATRLIYSPQGILYELIGKPAAGPAPAEELLEKAEAGTHPTVDVASAVVERKEKTPTVVLPGKLQTRPKEGNPDRQGKPTAWAQLLAHVEGREGATLLSTSFHGKAGEIALALSAGDHITAQGYLHLRPEDPVNPRLSTFSVVHLLEYPGKPAK